ncbi:DUF5671 domain-containing protein [Pseudarthrobacter sp. NPDC092439]|uniref:DUF5671 domain-containing protein n=1 Tax=unclassified Pseudarthrobacter TaxID=2647000 RepID=UPI00381A0DD5
MSASAAVTVHGAGSSLATLRRLIQYGLLFALVVIMANGLSGLLTRLFAAPGTLASADVASLALALAFTLIGGPLALLLWWVSWKRLSVESERRAVEWGLYLTLMYAVSLIIFSTSLFALVASFVDPSGNAWQPLLANAIVWAGIWLWHRWMWTNPAKPSAHLHDVRAVVGTVFGLVLGAVAAIVALAALLDVAIRGLPLLSAYEPWWRPAVQALVWAAGGAAVWWWHWFRDGGKSFKSGLVDVIMVLIGVFLAGLTALAGFAVVLFVLLRLAFDRGGPLNELLEPLAPAIAGALIGAVVWRYHRTASADRSLATRRAGLLVTSAVALAAAASGVGVIINALLAALVSPLAGGGTRTLLLGGISAVLVGGPVWWLSWKPRRQPAAAGEIPPGRRLYLVAFFGVSAVVALIALLVIGFRLFEFVLGDVSGGSFVDRIRAQLGLLVAAGLVAGYHFALWRRDRVLIAAAAPARKRMVERITLVTGFPPDPAAPDTLARDIAEATGGARVTVWPRAYDGGPAPAGVAGRETDPGYATRVADALADITAEHALVILGPGPRLEVIPLAAR